MASSDESARLLYLDIETAPNISYVWGQYEQDVIEHVVQSYILCYAYMWEGDSKPSSMSIPDSLGEYKPTSDTDDKKLCIALRDLLDEANIVIAHNGDRFDLRKINARLIFHEIDPPSPYQTIDTRKVASRYAAFNSNRLGSLGEHLGFGGKAKHDGFDMWLGCMMGDKKYWKEMLKYNVQDVKLLRDVYMRLRPFMKNHPPLNQYNSDAESCPRCGADGKNLTRRGLARTRVSTFQQWQCGVCKGYSRTRLGEPVSRVKKPTHVSL